MSIDELPGSEIAVPRGRDAVEVKKSASLARADMTRAMNELEQNRLQMRTELERQRAELEADFARRRAELEEQMRPLKEQLAKMREVMWTVDLYLGRDETLRLLRDGAPAPADTPIGIRQRVLVMAEESLVMMDHGTSGMTVDDIPKFVDWLIADPAHLDRVLPEQRGVVVMVPTRVAARSGNAFEDAARDAANKSSWWLLRNGERIYLLTVDPALDVADRVLPRRTEFVEVFDRRMFGFGRAGGVPVEPGSDEWLEMERRADARRRHYMRVMLVLQGIIDRTPVWAPLPDGGVNLLSLADQDAGKIVLLQNDETSIQITDGRETFGQWQRRLNNLMRPGIRVIGNWANEDFRDLKYRDWRGRDVHRRLYPATVDSIPAAGVPHLIEDRRDGGFVIRFERTDKVYRRGVPVPGEPGYVYRGEYPVDPARRASCVVMPDDTWVLPVDLATTAELEYYLNSRDNRSRHFLSMVPTVKAALAVKHTEAATEAPFRALLAQVLIGDGADPDTIDDVVEDLVHWWKVGNTWSRPLNGEPDHEARAVRAIAAEFAARRAARADDTTEAMVRAGRRVPNAVYVARTRTGRWHVYARSTPALDPGVFLDVTAINSDGTLGETRHWRTLSQRSASRLHIGWSDPDWDTWQFAAQGRWYLTGPERQELLEEVIARSHGELICVTEVRSAAAPVERAMVSYAWTEGTPETAPVDGGRDGVLGHYSRSSAVNVQGWMVIKDADGVRLDADAQHEMHYPSYFGGYSATTQWGGDVPWWPDTAHRYDDVVERPRLVWSDTTMLARIADYRSRCAAAVADARRIADRREDVARSYSAPIAESIRSTLEAEARARFADDFGDNAWDLWPAHLEMLDLDARIPSRWITALISIALSHDLPVEGTSIGDLIAHADSDSAREVWRMSPSERERLAEYASLTVPAIATTDTVAEDDPRGGDPE